ncbi:MAG: DUF115 domain-containing protein [Treponema sp.]|jgi:hypothetical protein|nr:DUF115 domain-containing protein [Treponema sp.]
MSDATPRQLETRRGCSVSYQGKTLLSRIDPIGQAERLAASIPCRSRTLYFCPSPLYGYGLEMLLSRINDDSAVLCVEADEQLLALSLTAPEALFRLGSFSNDHPRLRLIPAGDAAGLCGYMRETWGSRTFRRVETIHLTGGWQLFPERYASLAKALQRDIALDWGNALTLVKLGRLYSKNVLCNLSLIPRSRGIGDICFGESPVLVLGAGPSLDGVLEGLDRFFGAALYDPDTRPFKILCVDTCLSSLKARNIKPDLVAALESQHWNLRDFIGLGSWEVPLAMDLSALPATGDMLGGQVFLFATPWTPLRIFERLHAVLPETFWPLGSVGLSAVALALRVSSGPVITGGIDFSFTLDKYHARSTPGHLERLRRHTRFQGILNEVATFRHGVFTIQSKSGLSVRSDPAMKTYRDLFEREFAGEPRLWDYSTEGVDNTGLPLGIKTLSPEAAVELLKGVPGQRHYSPVPVKGELQQAVKAFICQERATLIMLKDICTGAVPGSPEQREALLDECDYLWAHFPECAGAGGRRPPGTDISFLKRVRTEIDPFIEILDRVDAECIREGKSIFTPDYTGV